MTAVTLDLDDFSLLNHRLLQLDALASVVAGLKVTLFTVPCPANPREFAGPTPSPGATVAWLRQVLAVRPWLECALHGWHHTPLECAGWDRQRALDALLWAEGTGVFVRGFKAPYWETSPGLYAALLERGWWVADHDRNAARRPPALRAYLLDRPERVHGHVQNTCGNGLAEAWDTYRRLVGPFAFVSEVMA